VPNRLEPLNVADFTGGLNLRSTQFQLAPNESPELNNITIDPLGGIYTRSGWERWNETPIVPEDEPWDPRRAYLQQLSDGSDIVYVAANGTIHSAGMDHVFTDLAIPCSAPTHLADFVTIGDDLYIACGKLNASYRRHGEDPPAALAASGAGNWNDDYLNPVGGKMPQADLAEAHAGYLFVANITEDGVDLPNRLRWSHPSSPGDWAQLDYIDIGDGGSHITGLISYEDHLLIFKNDSMWALYGYETESWQLVKKSATVGGRGPQGITRNEQAVFFYSASDRGGIYVYAGERPTEISSQLRRAFENIIEPDLIWVGWIARKLWVTLPWTYDGPTTDNAAVFVFDPTVGEGAWMYYSSSEGALGPIVGGSNADSQIRPLAVLRDTECHCLVRLNARQDAADLIGDIAVLGVSANPASWELGILTTEADVEIIADGSPALAPFETVYRTAWADAGWPTRKKSFRRPDFVCRVTGLDHTLRVASFRDYDEVRTRRQSQLDIQGGGESLWGEFDWLDGSEWGESLKGGAEIRRGSSFGMCRALQLRVAGVTPGARWGIDAIILKLTMRRFR
jgi:hypothetical protein